MDDFYPINSEQQNSFIWYVREFYIKGLGLDPAKALLIDPPQVDEEKPDPEWEVKVDNWCMAYEKKIRDLGGIGFFLGGIGPDGHIAFNIRGSDHYSTTRLTGTNYETQAAAAGDLGGIEISGKKKVITIGLGTITFNPDCVAIIFAAGDTKAPMVRDAIENLPDARYPGTALHKLPNARFFLTSGAASLLTDAKNKYMEEAPPSVNKSIRELLEFCQSNRIYAHKISPPNPLPGKEGGTLRSDPGADSKTPPPPFIREGAGGRVEVVTAEVQKRLARGMENLYGKTILHTGPHHDDIMLGLMPVVHRQLRDPGNRVAFAVLTSGFTALSNHYLIDILEFTKKLIRRKQIQMLHYEDFFDTGFLFKWDKDVNHYLNQVAERDEDGKRRGLSHRVVRCMVKLYGLKSATELTCKIADLIEYLKNCYDGEKNTPDVQKLKGMIREFEEELVWAHSGIQVKDVHHLRLGFYQGDIFTEQPEINRDVKPVADLIRRIKPNVISVTMDPEGSGPDTHYKVLQTIAAALRELRQKTEDRRHETVSQETGRLEDDKIEDGGSGVIPAEASFVIPAKASFVIPAKASFVIPAKAGTPSQILHSADAWNPENITIIGYRNVWYRYHPAEANVYWPVSLNAMAVMQNSFRQCYLSQVDASFPSPALQGPFSDVAQRVWVEQFREVQLLLGKDYFYENKVPLLRATHGLIFYKELSLDEFLNEARELARRTE